MIKVEAEVYPLYGEGLFELRLTVLDGDVVTTVTKKFEAINLISKSLLDYAFDSLKMSLVDELSKRAGDWQR